MLACAIWQGESCQKSGGFHQFWEEVVGLTLGWLSLCFPDLALCLGGIETGLAMRLYSFWIRRQGFSI